MMLLAGWVYARHGGLVFLGMAAISGMALVLIAPLARVMSRPLQAGPG